MSVWRGEVGSGPEHNSTKTVKGQSHEDGNSVSEALHDLSGN